MSANLTLQFLRAEKAYRSARTPQEELECLQTMLVELPKHKGTDKMHADLKQKISKVKKQLASAPKPGSKQTSLRIPRQGAGRAIVIGGPNSGKSQLVASLTRAKPLVADFPFSTREPSPGMMPWQDVYVQLIDTPPMGPDSLDADVQALIRGAELVILLLDLGSDDGGEQLKELWDRMQNSKTRLAKTSHFNRENIGVTHTKTIFVPNKIDLSEAQDRYEFFQEFISIDLPELQVSAKQGNGLDELRRAIYSAMDVVRVYTKHPNEKEPDLDKPYTISRGGTLAEVAAQIHHEIAANLKSARVWGVNVHPGTTVTRDYVLEDKDIIELHT